MSADSAGSAAANTEFVLAFYRQAFNDDQSEAAAAAHLGSTYTQHNPQAQDGPDFFVGYVHWLRGQFPQLQLF